MIIAKFFATPDSGGNRRPSTRVYDGLCLRSTESRPHAFTDSQYTDGISINFPGVCTVLPTGLFRNCLNCELLRWSCTHFTEYTVRTFQPPTLTLTFGLANDLDRPRLPFGSLRFTHGRHIYVRSLSTVIVRVSVVLKRTVGDSD